MSRRSVLDRGQDAIPEVVDPHRAEKLRTVREDCANAPTISFGCKRSFPPCRKLGITVKNNIFTNTMTGGSATMTHACVQLPTGANSSMNLTLNNNAYYQGTGATNYILATTLPTYYLATNFNATTTTPAANSRSFTSTLSTAGTNDNACFATTSAAPFVSSTDLHINSGSTPTLLESGGMVVGVNSDIDGQTRPGPVGSVNGGGVFPDIGADEFDGVPLDILGHTITYAPLAALCALNSTYVLSPVSIVDFTGVPTTGSFVPIATEPEAWQSVAEGVDGHILSTPYAGGFVGTYIGIYASSNGQPSTNTADFDVVRIHRPGGDLNFVLFG